MANMSYCRFNNTSEDLQDCIDELEEPCSKPEHEKRIKLVRLCAEVVFNYAEALDIDEATNWAETLPRESE